MSRISSGFVRLARVVFWLVVAGLAANALRIHVRQATASANVLTRITDSRNGIRRLVRAREGSILPAIPYTAILQEYSVKDGGVSSPTQRVTFAVRSDGSRLIETADNDGASKSSERILEFASGERQYVMDLSRTKSTTYDPERVRSDAWLLDPRDHCLSASRPTEEADGDETVGGYRTARVVEGAVTRWLALDYGCAPVKERAAWVGSASEKRLVALVPGEPAAALFEVPSDFRELSFSAMFPAPNAAAQDGYYYSHRPPQ